MDERPLGVPCRPRGDDDRKDQLLRHWGGQAGESLRAGLRKMMNTHAGQEAIIDMVANGMRASETLRRAMRPATPADFRLRSRSPPRRDGHPGSLHGRHQMEGARSSSPRRSNGRAVVGASKSPEPRAREGQQPAAGVVLVAPPEEGEKLPAAVEDRWLLSPKAMEGVPAEPLAIKALPSSVAELLPPPPPRPATMAAANAVDPVKPPATGNRSSPPPQSRARTARGHPATVDKLTKLQQRVDKNKAAQEKEKAQAAKRERRIADDQAKIDRARQQEEREREDAARAQPPAGRKAGEGSGRKRLQSRVERPDGGRSGQRVDKEPTGKRANLSMEKEEQEVELDLKDIQREILQGQNEAFKKRIAQLEETLKLANQAAAANNPDIEEAVDIFQPGTSSKVASSVDH